MRRILLLMAVFAAVTAYPAATLAGPNGSDNGTACVLNTKLSPANEVPPANSEAKGHAQVKVRNDGTIEWKVFILNKGGEAIRAGHIHRAPSTAAGPVVQGLYVNPGGDTSKQFRDRGEVQNAALAMELCTTPSAFYVNYHSVQNPPGLARGQLG